MYGFWSAGSRPLPFAGTAPATRSNGLDTNAAMPAKNVTTAPRTAATQGIRSRSRRRPSQRQTAVAAVSTVSQSRSDPGWLAQKAVKVYGDGSSRLVVSATTWSEKSCVASASTSVAAAISVAAQAAKSAFRPLAAAAAPPRQPAHAEADAP